MRRSSIHTISIFLFIFLISSSLVIAAGTAYAFSSRNTDDSAVLAGVQGASATVLPSLHPTGHKIRVAQIDLSNFYDSDKQGPTGYGFEYLKEISNYTGWDYEYISVTKEQGLEMLNDGEVDLLAPALMTEDLKKRFDYSKEEIGLNYSVLCVSLDSKTAVNDFKAIDGMKVGLLKGDSVNATLEPYAKAKGFQVKTVEYENQAVLLKALHNGEIDAILTGSLEKRPTERIIAEFAPSPFYFITAKGNREILEPLDNALAAIKASNSYYDYELQKKYYSWDYYSLPLFTEEEKEYIRNAGVLKAVYDPALPPIEYYDNKTGKYAGITADIFQLISDMTGLRFSFEKTGSYSDALKKISDGEADILTGIDSDVQWASRHNLSPTDSYLSASIVLVKNERVKNLNAAATALAKDYLVATEYIKDANPDANIKYYNTPLECFEAVNRGDADITYANRYVAEKLIENPRLNRLKIVETVNLADHLCIGVSDSVDPVLLSILNKSIHSITDTQLNSIIFNHTINEKPEITLEYLFFENPRFLISILLVLFLVTTVTMVFIIRVKNYHNEEIKNIAYQDSVTGTWNYNKFKVDAQTLLRNAKGKKYAIVYIDIYRFSYINDTFGYYNGDIILSEVAKELEFMAKESECTARISADNYVCLLEYESDDALITRGRLFQQNCNERLIKINSRFKVQFTSAIYRVARGETDIPSLVGKADIAHKTIGDVHKDFTIFYDEKIQNEFLRKKMLESAMASSLKNGDFLVYLQPKIDLTTNRIIGTEALARWRHPTEGLILPELFISLFESNGFILELDFYIYERVCQLLRKWLDDGKDAMPVSVNVSKAHLAYPQFGLQLKALIDKYGIAPELLELELTESILFNDAEEAVEMIKELKELGFSILIDDFGSGYSSLNMLKDLTVDVLKLDKEFFRKDGMEEKDKIIVDGIIRIAKDLHLGILSEGVETQEQVDFLTGAGCDSAQGYFFAKPMPVDDFEKLVGYSK